MTIKILHLYSSWTEGGAEKVMIELACALEKKGYKNIIASPRNSYILRHAAQSDLSVYPCTIRGSFDPVGFITLLNIVMKENIDIIHAHQGKVFWPCVFIKCIFPRIKIVFHRHADLGHRFYSRMHYKWANRVIAISKAVANGLINREKVSPDKIDIIYNGTDFARFNSHVSPQKVRKLYNLGDYPVIGAVGAMNLPKGKGQRYLIEAARILNSKFGSARYMIVGDGPYRRELEEIAEKEGISDKVIFCGFQKNVEEYIAAMDVVCLLSWDTEGFGQVLVEAQAMAKPVIGTNIGGVPETFQDKVTGFLIPAENPIVLAEVLSKLLSDNELRARMGKAAAEFVTKRFAMENMVDEVIKSYEH